MIIILNKAQLATGGIFYCRDSAGFSVSVSDKLSCILTVKCFEIGNKTYCQNVVADNIKTWKTKFAIAHNEKQ